MRRNIHPLPLAFVFPERTGDRRWSTVERCDDSGRISVPLYRKIRGQGVWIKRSETEIEIALSKAASTKQRAYLKKVQLSSLAH
jgi:hypothetical protein